MNKIIINFHKGGYSSRKDEFKKIFAGNFRWNGKQAWVGRTGYVKASKKMESGEAITFLIECNDKLTDKFFEFSKSNKIDCKIAKDFDNIDVIDVKEEPESVIEHFGVKLDRAENFRLTAMYRKDLSPKFIDRWAKLLEFDDDKFNNNIGNDNQNKT